jgi:hypothetical protein
VRRPWPLMPQAPRSPVGTAVGFYAWAADSRRLEVTSAQMKVDGSSLSTSATPKPIGYRPDHLNDPRWTSHQGRPFDERYDEPAYEGRRDQPERHCEHPIVHAAAEWECQGQYNPPEAAPERLGKHLGHTERCCRLESAGEIRMNVCRSIIRRPGPPVAASPTT